MNTKTLLFFILTISISLSLISCSEENNKPIRVGDTVASFSSIDLEGKTFSLSSHEGKPVIIRFFLLNCPYCKADTPIFNLFYDKYRQKGLEIVYVNNNGSKADEVKTFAEELKIDFSVIFDPEGKIARQYNVKVQPLTLVLSPEHKLLAALLGGVSEAELDELLSQYIK